MKKYLVSSLSLSVTHHPPPTSKMLPPSKFIDVIEHTQLVSVDLIVMNAEKSHGDAEEVLVGKRVNEPARGMWFVPGSRLYKGETIAEGVKRVSRTELGVEVAREQCTLLGAYDHLYDTNFLQRTDAHGKLIPTHYVVLGMKTALSPTAIDAGVFCDQHAELRWMPVPELLARDDVHQLTKNYFL